MVRLPASVSYSLLLFAPLLVLMLLPVPCLGSECVLLASTQLADPTSMEPGELAGFCAWGFGPLPTAVVVLALGVAAHRLTGSPHPQPSARVAVWGMFSVSAFAVAWYGIILVTSVGASETPPMEFLGITARMALAAAVLGQPLVLLWLSLVDRHWRIRAQREATIG